METPRKKLKDLAPQNPAADQPKLTDAAANITKADVVSILTPGKETAAALALTVKDLKSVQAVFTAKISPTAGGRGRLLLCPVLLLLRGSVHKPIRAA